MLEQATVDSVQARSAEKANTSANEEAPNFNMIQRSTPAATPAPNRGCKLIACPNRDSSGKRGLPSPSRN